MINRSYCQKMIQSLIFLLISISTVNAQLTVHYEKTFPPETIDGRNPNWTIDDQGNVYLFGCIYNYSEFIEFTLLKVDDAGEIIWQKNFDGPHSNTNQSYVFIDSDGSLIVAGQSYDDDYINQEYMVTAATLTVHKYDTDGNALWGSPLYIEQDLTCAIGIGRGTITVDEAGFIYIATGTDTSYCSVVYGITPEGGLAYSERLNEIQIGALLEMGGSVVAICGARRTVYCEDLVYPEENWYNIEQDILIREFTSGGVGGTLFGPWGIHSCDIDVCGDYTKPACKCSTSPDIVGRIVRGGPSGNITVPFYVENYCMSQGYFDGSYDYFISGFTPEGDQTDYFEIDNSVSNTIVDNQGDLILVTRDNTTYRYSTVKLTLQGDLLWEVVHDYDDLPYQMDIDANDYIYQMDRSVIRCLNPDNGDIEWECPLYLYGQAHPPQYVRVDDNKRIYVLGAIDGAALAAYDNQKKFAILDGSEDNNPIANTEFWLIKMQNDIPNLTEDTLGVFETDENGEFELIVVDCGEFEFVHDLYNGSTSDIISIGDSLKIAKHVYSKAAVKHPDILNTMYSLHLDNATFKINGEMVFDTLDNMSNQEIILNHTEFRYNLVVAIEWDTKVNYLTILEDNMSYMSNFLYDITDGQVRLDTVRIYDNKENWYDADIRIKADNMMIPHCRNDVAGITYPSASGQGREIIMPRKWFGRPEVSRNETEIENIFYSLESRDYRTKAHEFGHYAFGFYDEYLFWDADSNKYREGDELKCSSMQGGNYGFMETHYFCGEPFASEMSSRYRYEDSECQNTEHFRRYEKACWDHFETWVEAFTWGSDNMYVPLLKPDLDDPDERHDIGTDYLFTGPNNDLESLDYDVGNLVHFTETPEPPNPGFDNVHIQVTSMIGGKEADVILINSPYDPSNLRYFEQGQTADNERMKVLGVKTAENDHIIQAWKSGTQWSTIVVPKRNGYSSSGPYACGTATASKSGVGKAGNYFNSSSSGDTLEIELRSIEGDFPIINEVILSESQCEYRLQFINPFQSNPTLDLLTDYGHQSSFSLNSDGNVYTQLIADSLGDNGFFAVWAVDDSGEAFFFINDYIVSNLNFIGKAIRVTGLGGQCELLIDTLNVSVQKAVIVSSSYPVPTSDFTDEVVKAGKTHSVSYYPDDPLTGNNQIYIFYSDGDLVIDSTTLADENSLCIYKWNSSSELWENLGGSVDTSLNYVTETITGPGVYAAFSMDFITDVEDEEHGEILPYRFELSQNYPNPFNPVTNIEYNIPTHSYITIEVYNILGQKIRTLVDESKSAGDYQITWDGNDSNGAKVSTGIYFYRFQAGDYVETKKMILLK